MNLVQFYVEAVVEDDRQLHAIYVIGEIGEECKREMDLPPEKRARVCLACKGENGHSNVVF